MASVILVGGVLALAGCSVPNDDNSTSVDTAEGSEALKQRADELAKAFLIADTHIDVPYRLQAQIDKGQVMEDVGERTASGDFDYPRAKEGGLDLPFMSIYIPATYQETGGAKELADELIDLVEGIATKHPDKFAMVDSIEGAQQAFESGRVGFALGIENGAPIENSLENLKHFYDRGVRYITLTHSKDNAICDSSYDETGTWGGLSPFGKELIVAMNDIGMIIDISHISDSTFDQVMELSKAPVLATHSSCRSFTPGWERNMSDEMIRKLADNGGVIQINFGSSFISDAYRQRFEKDREHVLAWAAEEGHDPNSQAVLDYREALYEKTPKVYADISDVVAHIDHVVELVGVDHVGIGSDYDGVGDSLPTGLKDVSSYRNLILALLEAGYSEADIEKICSGNTMRVWREVNRVACGQLRQKLQEGENPNAFSWGRRLKELESLDKKTPPEGGGFIF